MKKKQNHGSYFKCPLEHFQWVIYLQYLPAMSDVEILEMKGFSLLKHQNAFNLTSRNKCGFVFTV